MKRAASLITQKVDKIALELEQNIDEEQTVAPKEKVYYSSVAYLQLTDDTMRLDAFKDKGDYEGLLTLAKEYYDGNGINEEYTYSSPIQNRGDNLLIEDKDFAVVYNGSVGGTYEVMLKFTEKEVRDHNASLDANLQTVNEKLNNMEEYREELQEAEYSGGMRR